MYNIATLNEEAIKSKTPAVYNEDKKENLSAVYNLFNTAHIIQNLRGEGYIVTETMNINPHRKGELNLRKHCVRMTHEDFIGNGDDRPELVLYNSHDGLSPFKVMSGVFRLVCSNGLVIRSSQFEDAKIMHKGHDEDEVIKCALNIGTRLREVYPMIDNMKKIELSEKEKKDFAYQAALLRFTDKEKIKNPEALLTPRRSEDTIDNSLWEVYNVIQENSIRGGVTVGNRSLRAIKGLDKNIEVNRELWNIAENYMLAA